MEDVVQDLNRFDIELAIGLKSLTQSGSEVVYTTLQKSRTFSDVTHGGVRFDAVTGTEGRLRVQVRLEWNQGLVRINVDGIVIDSIGVEVVGVSIDSEDFGEYWITRHATSCYQGAHELSHREKMMCLQESLKLSSEGLIAFWTVNSDEGDIKNPRIVIRAISDFKDKEIDHKDKEKKR